MRPEASPPGASLKIEVHEALSKAGSKPAYNFFISKGSSMAIEYSRHKAQKPLVPHAFVCSMRLRALLSLALLCLVALPLAAQEQLVIASTSWVQAYAVAAGAKNIVTIAPFELQHPPEYEIKPSDLLAVQNASLIVYSSYEKFAKKLAETAQNKNIKIVAVYTDNVPSNIIAESKKSRRH